VGEREREREKEKGKNNKSVIFDEIALFIKTASPWLRFNSSTQRRSYCGVVPIFPSGRINY